MKLRITKTLVAIMTLSFVSTIALPASEIARPFEQSLLIGTWLDHRNAPIPPDVHRRIEFSKEGTFRSNNQIGEVSRGTWRWISIDTIELKDGHSKRATKWKLKSITKTLLRGAGPEPAEYLRLESWTSKAPTKQAL